MSGGGHGKDWQKCVSLEAESSVIGAALLEPSSIDMMAAECGPEHFAHEGLRKIWAAILDIAASGERVTVLAVRPHAVAAGVSSEELSGLLEGAPIIGCREAARQVRLLSERRELGTSMEAAVERLRSGSGDMSDILRDIDRALWTAVRGPDGDQAVSAGKAVAYAIERAEKVRAGEPIGISSGLRAFDNLVGPMSPGQLIIIGGRPGMGKSALAQRIARGLAERGHGTLIISPEMTAPEIGLRLASDLTFEPGAGGVPYQLIRKGQLTPAAIEAVRSAAERAQKMPLHIIDSGACTLGRISAAARRWQRAWADKAPLGAILVDYLQLCRPDASSRDLYMAVSEVSRGLKQIAKERRIVVIALAQLSRAVEFRNDKRPTLSDLRESGQIEQDADCVLFCYREEYYLRMSEPPADSLAHDEWRASIEASRNRMEIICAKSRAGMTGSSSVRWFGDFQAIRD